MVLRAKLQINRGMAKLRDLALIESVLIRIGKSKSDSIRDCLSGSILTILASASNSFLNLLRGGQRLKPI